VFCCHLQMASDSAGDGVKSATGGSERCRGPDCEKPVKPGSGSVYCTEACIHAHTQESLQLLRQERSKNASARSVLKISPVYHWCFVMSLSTSRLLKSAKTKVQKRSRPYLSMLRVFIHRSCKPFHLPTHS